ncbi:hypothetical protein DBR42_00140 [Pelomonas sp. HMWF004]|nr:hypothetical protein DBR42_00140 [Pelomonas sp. HMWF004]
MRTAAAAIFGCLLMSYFALGANAQTARPDMAACAGMAVSMAKTADGAALDFSVKSLEYVDRTFIYLRTLKISNDQRDTLNGAFGCYVGEVIIRNLGGSWYFPSEEERSYIEERAIVQRGKLLSNPIGKVRKLMQNGIEDSVIHFYQSTEKLVGAYVEHEPAGKQ